jgi:CRP-like cAMP-binding protein
LLSGLSEADRLAVLRRARVTEFRRRQRIYHRGDAANEVYLVESGVVKLAVENPEGREAILGFQHPGDLFGELAVVDDGPHDHLAEAYEASVIWAISRDEFLDLMRESTALGDAVIRLLGTRLRMYRTRVREILHQSAHARVASTLVHLAGRHGVEDADGVVIPLRLSQRDIANFVGLTRETVNFILKDLRERKLIETQGRSIRVKNPAVLQHTVR